ncbi:MAG: hypothetical protein M3O01_16065 [Pseudomonadota bacterium]|nr:hypothetical protein [Pseudomonadota bacterium]
MNEPSTPPPSNPQRDALNESERRAERERPQNYKDKETAEKVVEVLPLDGDSAPIQGIDPDK